MISKASAMANYESSRHKLRKACLHFASTPDAEFEQHLPELLEKLGTVQDNRKVLMELRNAERLAKEANADGLTPSSQGATEAAKAVVP